MAKHTTATQSLEKTPAIRSKSDRSMSVSRRRKRIPDKQPQALNLASGEEQVAGAASSSADVRRASKQETLAGLLLRDEGATIAQMTNATGWLPHTVRAALTGLKKKGYSIDSDKVADVRTYRASAPR